MNFVDSFDLLFRSNVLVDYGVVDILVMLGLTGLVFEWMVRTVLLWQAKYWITE